MSITRKDIEVGLESASKVGLFEAEPIVPVNDIRDAFIDRPLVTVIYATQDPLATLLAGIEIGAHIAYANEDREADEWGEHNDTDDDNQEAPFSLEAFESIIASDPGPEESKPLVDESLPNVSEWPENEEYESETLVFTFNNDGIEFK